MLAARLLTVGLFVWFALLFSLVLVRMLKGDIHARGFLRTQGSPNTVDPERALAMAAFPFVIFSYLIEAMQANVIGVAHPSMPDIPQSLLTLLAGSNVLYLGGKVTRSS